MSEIHLYIYKHTHEHTHTLSLFCLSLFFTFVTFSMYIYTLYVHHTSDLAGSYKRNQIKSEIHKRMYVHVLLYIILDTFGMQI